jgi:hypothetical protein
LDIVTVAWHANEAQVRLQNLKIIEMLLTFRYSIQGLAFIGKKGQQTVKGIYLETKRSMER